MADRMLGALDALVMRAGAKIMTIPGVKVIAGQLRELSERIVVLSREASTQRRIGLGAERRAAGALQRLEKERVSDVLAARLAVGLEEVAAAARLREDAVDAELEKVEIG